MEQIKLMMDNTSEDGEESDEEHGHHWGFHMNHEDKWPTSFWTQFSCPCSQDVQTVIANNLVKVEFGTGEFYCPLNLFQDMFWESG